MAADDAVARAQERTRQNRFQLADVSRPRVRSEPIQGVRSLGDLPENARRYVSAIEEHAGVPIVLLSVGPERTQTIERAWRPMRKRAALPA